MKALKSIILIALMSGFLWMPVSLTAQIINPKRLLKEKATERINNKMEEGVEKGLNKVEEELAESMKKKAEEEFEKELEESAGGEVSKEDAVKRADKGSLDQDKAQKLESFTQYDFIPGDKILFFEDFSQDAIGDFPALWTSNGGGEVKTLNIAEGKWFHMNVYDAVFCYGQSIDFPENFILEFDIIPNADYSEFELTLYEDSDNQELDNDLYPGDRGLHINPNTEYGQGWLTKGYDADNWLEGSSERNPIVVEKVNHVIIWVQKRRVRIYHSGAKVLDMPTNLPSGTRLNRMRFATRTEEAKPYLSNIKITTASPDMRSKLLTEGKLISYGIYFDTGKDMVKPESYGSIKEIAAVLEQNPEVRIKIIGHTDSDGDDARNLDLSKRRAASVKNSLVQQFNIDAGRIETDGLGESQPIQSNSTAEGKAKNRRVEFLKL